MNGPGIDDVLTARPPGRLLLVPNTLDLGVGEFEIAAALPAAVLTTAATLAHWVVEDARSARAFLRRVGAICPLAQPLQSIAITELPRPRKGSGQDVPATAWAALLQPALAGHDIGLLSEAGLPAVADPGAAVVAAAHAAGVPVQPLAGPSAITLALAASGLGGQSFAFVGYLPQDAAARALRLKALEALSRREGQTQLFIETPYRNAALLETALAVLAPATRLSVSWGLTLPGGFTHSAAVADWRRRMPPLPGKLPAVFAVMG